MDPRRNPLCIIFVFCINRPVLCSLFLSSLKRTPGTYNRLSPHPPPRSDGTLLCTSSSSFLRTRLFPLLISTWEHLRVGASRWEFYHYYKEVELASYVKHIRWLFFFDSPLLWISGSHCIIREDSIQSEIGTSHGEPRGKPPKNSWSPPGGFKKRENWGQYHTSWWLEEVEIFFTRTVVSPCATLAWRNNCFHGLGH